MAKEIISDEVISIVELDKTMYEVIWKNSLDDNNHRFVPDEVFETLDDAREVVNFLIDSYQNEEGPFVYAVIRKEDNANMGYVQLIKIDLGYEIGYHIAIKYNGNGYASRSVGLFLEYLRLHSNLKEIYGIALLDNKASIRVLEKNGFEIFFEGTDLYQGENREIIKSIRKL